MLFMIVHGEESNITTFHSYNSFSELLNDKFPADCITWWLLDSEAPPKGRSYNVKKKRLQSKAIRYSYIFSEIDNNVSCSELAMIEDYFKRYGKRYGLLREFKENGII